MVKTFSNREEFLTAVAATLPAKETEAREAVLDGIRQADESLAQWQDRDNPGHELRLGRWFIRNDDLPFLQLLGAVASVLIAMSATGGIAAAAMVGPISNFAGACWQLKRKGTTLSEEQVSVLGVLHTIPSGTVDQIMDKLIAAGRSFDQRDVEVTLYSMAALELYDGSVVAIVRQDTGKRWRALHV